MSGGIKPPGWRRPRRGASENRVFRAASLESRAGCAGERYPIMQGGLLCGTHKQPPSRPLTAKRFKRRKSNFEKTNVKNPIRLKQRKTIPTKSNFIARLLALKRSVQDIRSKGEALLCGTHRPALLRLNLSRPLTAKRFKSRKAQTRKICA